MTDQKAVAEKLLQAKAIQLNPCTPFTWASGWKSPIYCDNRRILSFPYIRDFIKSELSNVVYNTFPSADSLAGVATAGIPWGALAADQLKLPYMYVRPIPKNHGLANQVEGHYEPGSKVIVIEDLISTGQSSLQVVEVLSKEGLEILGVVSIFNYGFKIAQDAFEKAGIRVISLTDYDTLIKLAIEKELVTPDLHNTLLNWRIDPSNWGAKN